MKKYISIITLFILGTLLFVSPVMAAKRSSKSYYYKSAKSGKFVQKKYYNSNPDTTYRGRR